MHLYFSCSFTIEWPPYCPFFPTQPFHTVSRFSFQLLFYPLLHLVILSLPSFSTIQSAALFYHPSFFSFPPPPPLHLLLSISLILLYSCQLLCFTLSFSLSLAPPPTPPPFHLIRSHPLCVLLSFSIFLFLSISFLPSFLHSFISVFYRFSYFSYMT